MNNKDGNTVVCKKDVIFDDYYKIGGNFFSKKIYTEEMAINLSKTLVNCIGCKDCVDCKDCFNCQNCKNCINCEVCNDCIDCKDCFNCQNCKNCINCEVCNDCVSIKGCFHTRNFNGQLVPIGSITRNTF